MPRVAASPGLRDKSVMLTPIPLPAASPLALVPAATLPHNVEAEAALLGALMIDNRLVEDVQLKLGSQHFFEPLHGRVYDAILMLIDRRMVATPVTLKPLFDADPDMMAISAADCSVSVAR
jgi:replicative DNA helicase